MFCEQCGFALPIKSQICPHCGAHIQALPDEQKRETMPQLSQLSEWRILSHIKPIAEEGAIEAGRNAELWLQNLVTSHLNYKGAYSFAGKRIRSTQQRKRREIDLIVVTPKKLHILEVKNWSGALHSEGDHWVQIKRGGERNPCENLTVDNALKQDLLIEYLQQHGIAIPKRMIAQKVIFINKNLQVDATIYNNPDVITYDKLQGYLNAQQKTTLAEKMLCSVMEYCLAQDKVEAIVDGLFGAMTQDTFHKIISALEKLHTWDRLILYGTKIITGDLIRIHISDTVYYRQKMQKDGHIKVLWTRNKFIGLGKALLGARNLGKIIFPMGEIHPISIQDAIYFHCAGSKQPQMIPLTVIDAIDLG